jgi:hypothetical protein
MDFNEKLENEGKTTKIRNKCPHCHGKDTKPS